jgi:uncharacterized secreted protein with C-terminal beta-propeller domain
MRRKNSFALIITLAAMMVLSSCTAFTGVRSDGHSDLHHAEDYDSLLKLMRAMKTNNVTYNKNFDFALGAEETVQETASAADSGENGRSFTDTNTQTAGVDEADSVKTDGRFLYVMAGEKLRIIDAEQPSSMKLISELSWNEYIESENGVKGETPMEFFLDAENNQLIVLTQSFANNYEVYDKPMINIEETSEQIEQDTSAEDAASETARDIWIGPMISERTSVNTIIYDISDKANPVEFKRFAQEGSYNSARKIDRAVYVVSQKYDYGIYSRIEEDGLAAEQALPSISKTGNSEDYELLPVDAISILPQGNIENQTIISAIDTENQTSDTEALAIIGNSGTIYSSFNNIYIAAVRYSNDEQYKAYTDIYRFKLDAASITADGSGTVDGWLLNQFSMDEHDGYLRVAVSEGTSWTQSEDSSSNSLYILDGSLNVVGSILDLAAGEQIKSVRFMGTRGWIVTFRTTDPLFGIDLSDPNSPQLLGELKIPGYSSYLHPISENSMLGFGRDVEVDGDNAYDRGLKISLFDISNLNEPVEKQSIILGGSGSWSEILYQHKSLMVDPTNNLYGFPALLADYNNQEFEKLSGAWFQGLLLINANDSQISVKGGISQIEGLGDWTGQTPVAEENEQFLYGNKSVYRGIRIGENIFTISFDCIQANNMNNLSLVGKLNLTE